MCRNARFFEFVLVEVPGAVPQERQGASSPLQQPLSWTFTVVAD